jgi:arrestin-related trafficking adapter 9
MPPAVDRSPSLSSPLSGRRIISRITSPFVSKTRSIAEFTIHVDDPHRQYTPGDLVTGSVRLRVVKPSRVTHIVICLHGFVQVFKNPGSPGEGFRANNTYVGTGRGKKNGEYFGNGFASLFEDEVVLCGDGRLAEGSYQFNFELQFPDKDLPSSIDVSSE